MKGDIKIITIMIIWSFTKYEPPILQCTKKAIILTISKWIIAISPNCKMKESIL